MQIWTTVAVALVASVIGATPIQADDWPAWGGPKHDIVWREKGIVETLPAANEDGLLPRVWSTPIAEGYSGPAVANGRVFITDFHRQTGSERVWCLDAETGKEIWQHSYRVRYTVSYPAGPRSTPVVDSGRVYTIGAMGDMVCFDEKTGDVQWKKNFPEEFGTKLAIWGQVASPLVRDNQLITLVGGKQNSLVVSFDKATGKELWRSLEDPQVGYCPPTLFRIHDKWQLIVWHPRGISSIDPDDGKVLWEHGWLVRAGLTIPAPRLVGDDQLFFTAFYNGPRMLKVADDNKSAEVVWKGDSDSEVSTDGLHSIMPTPVVTETHIYGVCSYGQLRCLDRTSGERVWETFKATGRGRWWNAFLIPYEPRPDTYFIHNEQGDLIIAKLTPKGYDELSRGKLVKPTRPVRRRQTIWSHPAFAMKSVFARNDQEIVRVNLAADAK